MKAFFEQLKELKEYEKINKELKKARESFRLRALLMRLKHICFRDLLQKCLGN